MVERPYNTSLNDVKSLINKSSLNSRCSCCDMMTIYKSDTCMMLYWIWNKNSINLMLNQCCMLFMYPELANDVLVSSRDGCFVDCFWRLTFSHLFRSLFCKFSSGPLLVARKGQPWSAPYNIDTWYSKLPTWEKWMQTCHIKLHHSPCQHLPVVRHTVNVYFVLHMIALIVPRGYARNIGCPRVVQGVYRNCCGRVCVRP